MTDSRWGGVMHQLRRTALMHDGAGLSDGQLLECFLARRDEAAFEALVRRHGPMVLGVCRRILANVHDAEDAFQAAFLVLARKAASIQPRDLVGNWLYGVAYRTALEARGVLARRRTKEKQVSAMPEPPAPHSEVNADLRPVLDEELSRLPDKYRVPVVLCDLEGRSRKEVAQVLGIPEGTLSSRLATARRMLGQRLARRGFGVSAAALAAFLAPPASAVLVPAPLIAATVHAATLFAVGSTAAAISTNVVLVTEGVLHAMFLTKLKTVTAVFALMAVLGGGLGLLGRGTSAGQSDGDKITQAKPADPKKGGGKSAPEAVQNRDVEKKLNATMNVKFENIPLQDILSEMRDSASLNIVVDKPAFTEAGITIDMPITMHLQGVTRKTALKYLLRDAGLAYRVADGILVITTPQADRAKLVRRVYPVADLVGPAEGNGAEDLIRVIRYTVGSRRVWTFRQGDEDDTFANNPEGGTVEYFAEGKSLVISQTSDIQDQVRELLEELRISKKQQEKN